MFRTCVLLEFGADDSRDGGALSRTVLSNAKPPGNGPGGSRRLETASVAAQDHYRIVVDIVEPQVVAHALDAQATMDVCAVATVLVIDDDDELTVAYVVYSLFNGR